MKKVAIRDSKKRFVKGANLGHPCYGGFNTRFKKGHSLLPGSEKGWFKQGSLNPNWKGEQVGYDALHSRLESLFGRENKCDNCGITTAKKYEWSNKSGEYKLDRSDWQRLCTKCHQRYDYENFEARKGFYG